jgi:hypothetical protein
MSEAMIIDVLVYGAGLLWLLTVVPAGVACCVRGQWMYFWFGWLTLGLLWYIGALARKPGQPPYEPRVVAIALAAAAAAFLALGLFGARPSPVLGLDGRALQGSVGGHLLGLDACRPKPDGGWGCSHYDDGLSGTVSYEVHANGLGCWHAVRVGGVGEGSRKHLSGCVTLYDFVS